MMHCKVVVWEKRLEKESDQTNVKRWKNLIDSEYSQVVVSVVVNVIHDVVDIVVVLIVDKKTKLKDLSK